MEDIYTKEERKGGAGCQFWVNIVNNLCLIRLARGREQYDHLRPTLKVTGPTLGPATPK